MSKKRKSYSAEFKTKVVLKLLKEEETAAGIASRYGVTVQTLNQWKKKFLENATLAFDVGEATKEYRQKIEKLERENEALAKTLGKTTIERDWAVGKLKSLDSSNKRRLVDSRLSNLSLTRQCQLLGLNRSGLYYRPRGISQYDLDLMGRYEEVYIKEYENVKELRAGIRDFITFYNSKRFHFSLGYRKPMNVYLDNQAKVA